MRVVSQALRPILAAAAASFLITSDPSHAVTPPVPGFPMYCVPGVTAERCRGTFWETGKLYEKGQEGGALSADEYTAALKRIEELRLLIRELQKAPDEEVQTVGQIAARARIELRQVGERVCNSLAGDEKIDNRRRLLNILQTLDNLDVATLNAAEDAKQGLPAGFTKVTLLLERTTASFDEFMRQIPTEPDPYV